MTACVGREYDGSTELYCYRARYYDPEIGRFVRGDPLGFQAGINFYAYVNNNPVNNNDPMGKLGGPFAALNMKDALSNPDFGRISNFSNVVGVTGTGLAAAPFVAGDAAGLLPTIGAGTSAVSGTALTSGLIGGATGALGTLATEGFNTRDLAINTGVGFIAGTLVPIRPVTGFLANTGKGALLGGSAITASQLIDISTDPSKNLQQNFNSGAVIGSAIGGGFTAGQPGLPHRLEIVSVNKLLPGFLVLTQRLLRAQLVGVWVRHRHQVVLCFIRVSPIPTRFSRSTENKGFHLDGVSMG